MILKFGCLNGRGPWARSASLAVFSNYKNLDVPKAKINFTIGINVTIGIKMGVTMVKDRHSSKHTTLQQGETEYGLASLPDIQMSQ